MTVLPIDFATPEHDETVRLRYDVLRKPLGLHFTVEQLAKEWRDAVHLACFDARWQIVGCLILTKIDEKMLKMRQVAVAEALQKQGIGRRLVEASEVWAQQRGFEKMTLNARAAAVDFYEKLGYETLGEPFEEVGIPHRKMQKRLV